MVSLTTYIFVVVVLCMLYTYIFNKIWLIIIKSRLSNHATYTYNHVYMYAYGNVTVTIHVAVTGQIHDTVLDDQVTQHRNFSLQLLVTNDH